MEVAERVAMPDLVEARHLAKRGQTLRAAARKAALSLIGRSFLFSKTAL